MFLYILNMDKEKMIKIGIATSIERIKQHLRTYNNLIDLEESYIVTAKDDNTIRMLERQFLNDYKEFAIDNIKFSNLDGATELRRIEILKDILEDIQYKSNKLKLKDIKIKKGIIIENKTQSRSNNKVNNNKKKINITNMDHLLNIGQIEAFIRRLKKYKDNIVSIHYSNENVVERINFEFKDENEYEGIGVISLHAQKGGCNLINYEEHFLDDDSIILELYINSKNKNGHKKDGLNYYTNMFFDNIQEVLKSVCV
ncbi:hypothetical protein [Clostridium haemolyticum]|nr:hypothetical protein [Clostridium haemolyticum]